jgi:hypothetical protein
MASVLAPCAAHRGFEPSRVKPKTIKLVFVASPLSTQHEGERAKYYRFKIRIKCQGGATFVLADCCFSALALKYIHLNVWVRNKAEPIIISWNINLFSPGYNWKIAELALNNDHSGYTIWCLTLYGIKIQTCTHVSW